jgi:hypothetical protein
MNKIAITVLTRGYSNILQYDLLIKRNIFIYENIINKSNFEFDMIIFHEGNISQDHQNYISEKSKQYFYNYVLLVPELFLLCLNCV